MNIDPRHAMLAHLSSALSRRFEGEGIYLKSIRGADSVTGAPAACSHIFTRLDVEINAVNHRLGVSHGPFNIRRHPVIELRVCAQWITLELIITPEAWFDQFNLLGKLSIPHHRSDLQKLLQNLHPDTKLGAWKCAQLSEENIEARHFHLPRVYNVWASTFIDGRDWIRIGRWIPLDEVNEDLTNELLQNARQLYSVFNFIAWNSRNDFQNRYEQQIAKSY